jgi:hypothetical protein
MGTEEVRTCGWSDPIGVTLTVTTRAALEEDDRRRLYATPAATDPSTLKQFADNLLTSLAQSGWGNGGAINPRSVAISGLGDAAYVVREPDGLDEAGLQLTVLAGGRFVELQYAIAVGNSIVSADDTNEWLTQTTTLARLVLSRFPVSA